MMINLKLLAEDLQDDQVDPRDTRRRALLKVDALRREAERLQSLFDDFLNLTGPCTLNRSATDLNAVVTRLVEFCEPLLTAHRVRVRTVLQPGALTCPVDEKLISQALLNLVINAQQAMPEGGEIVLSAMADADQAVIRVSDNGMGIAEHDRERIFRPFFSNKVGGTGLGLPITQRIIHEHGGTLDFASEPRKGTTFTLRLPMRPPPGP